MGCDRRTFVRASVAAGAAAAGTTGVSAARAQETGTDDGNATGNGTGGNGTQTGGAGNGTQAGNGTGNGTQEGGEGNASGGGESGGPDVDMQSLTLIFGAAVMAALSPIVFGLLLLLRGRGGDDGREGSTGGRRFDAP